LRPSVEFELEDEPRLARIKAPPAIYPQVYAHDLTLVQGIRPLAVSVEASKAGGMWKPSTPPTSNFLLLLLSHFCMRDY
jgi:hypothetical protein